MMLVRSSVKYSHIHGLGCFAEEDIKQGQVVWKFDPAVDLVFQEVDLAKFPDSFQEFLKIYSYSPLEEEKKTFILCCDHARHMNHSPQPNLLDIGELNIAARDIKAGEELTCDYNHFDRDASLKLGKNT